MDKLRVLKHYAYQEVTADLLNSIAESLFSMQDGMAQAFIAGFLNTDHLIFQDLDVTPDNDLSVLCGLKGVFLYRTDAENCVVGVYKGYRPDRLTPYEEETISFDPADLTNPRIDIIEAEIVDEDDVDYHDTVQMFNQLTETSEAALKYVRRVRNVKLYKKTGTPSVTPVAPTATAGRFTLREINVAANATNILPGDIIAQALDPEFTLWSIDHGVIQFPSIYEVIMYVKQQIAQNRVAFYGVPGTYQYYVPIYRTSVNVEIAGGGGGGSGASVGTPVSGADGGDSYITGIVKANGGKGASGYNGGRPQGMLLSQNGNGSLSHVGQSIGAASAIAGIGGGEFGGMGRNTNVFKGFFAAAAQLGSGNIVFTDSLGLAQLRISDNRCRSIQTDANTNTLVDLFYYQGKIMMGNSHNLYVVEESGFATLFAGDALDASSSIDGALGVNRMKEVRSYLVDPEDDTKILFIERASSGSALSTLRSIDQNGTITTVSNFSGTINGPVRIFKAFATNFLITVSTNGGGAPNVIARYDRVGDVTNPIHDPTAGQVNATPISNSRFSNVIYVDDYAVDKMFVIDISPNVLFRVIDFSGNQVSTVITYGPNPPSIPVRAVKYDVSEYAVFINQTADLSIIERFTRINDFAYSTQALAESRTNAVFATPGERNEDAHGRLGSGGAGGTAIGAAVNSGAGGGSSLVRGTFAVTPGQILVLVVGAGGLGGSSGADTRGGSGGDGFIKISW